MIAANIIFEVIDIRPGQSAAFLVHNLQTSGKSILISETKTSPENIFVRNRSKKVSTFLCAMNCWANFVGFLTDHLPNYKQHHSYGIPSSGNCLNPLK